MNIAFQTAICRLKLRGAGLRGSALHLAGLTGPAPGEVRELFPHLTRGEAVATARSIRSLEARRRVYDDFESRVPLAALAPLVHWKDEEPLRELARNRQPAILLTWHVGIVVGLRAGLHKLGIEAMILRNMIGEGRNEGIHLVGVGRMTPAGRAQALKKTLDHLRDGGIVVVNIDGLQGESRVETNCMGRKVGYAGGVVALARMSGARVIPAMTRWSDASGQIELIVRDRLELPSAELDPAAWEAEFAAKAAAVFEEFVMQNPGQLPSGWLERFLRSPRVDPAHAPAAE